jgi:hypothetical protein
MSGDVLSSGRVAQAYLLERRADEQMLIGHRHLLLTNRRGRVTIGADASCPCYHIQRRQKERLAITQPDECLHSPHRTKNEKTSGCPPLIFSPILQLKNALEGRPPNDPGRIDIVRSEL